MAQENIPNVTFDELVVEVEKSLKDMHKELRRQRNKYGAQYNYKNNYEQLNRRFGEDPRKLIDEYNLILDKKSNQPVAVREPIKVIVQTAINRLIEAKEMEVMEKAMKNVLASQKEKVTDKPKKKRTTTKKKKQSKT